MTQPTAGDVKRHLEAQVEGAVTTAIDPGYDEARRVWNGMIDRRPLAIVRAVGTGDAAPVIRVARELRLPLAVRGGGHNVAGDGTVDDGIVLDLGGLADVELDVERRTVRVGPGATLGDVDRATAPAALAVPLGVISGTGVAGLTLGGGVGWLTRPHGLTADNLDSIELVTAAGQTVRATERDDPELFWGLRGGGGNFGIVTSFTFRAHPLEPSVFAGTFVYGLDRWHEALRAYAAWTADQPDAMNSIISFFVPPASWDMGGAVLMFVGFAWADADHAEGERVVAPLRAAAAPDVEVLEPTTWVAWQSAADELFPRGSRAYWKNAAFDRLDDAAIDVIVDHAGTITWRGTAADIHHMEGAFGRVVEDATPFPNRSARFWLNVYGYWREPSDDPAMTAWVRDFHAAIEPLGRAGEYVNFLGRDDGSDARTQALRAYGPAKLERLVAIKRRLDPDNVFRLNHNIPPD